MLRRHRSRQQGQVVVLFALGSTALVALVGLVVMAGLLYWNQREMQTVADAAALAGAAQLSGSSCNTATSQALPTAINTLASELNVTAPSSSGWTCGSPFGPVTFSTNVKATFCYPWQGRNDEVAVLVTRNSLPFYFQSVLGTPAPTNPGAQSCTSAPLQEASGAEPATSAWAVAQRIFDSLPKSFGLVAAHGLLCQGSGAKIDVGGSLYAGKSSVAGQASISHNGNCAVYTHETTAADGSVDWGDILAYDQTPLGTCSAAGNPCWLGSAGKCTPPSGSTPGSGIKASFCADGFELQGYASPSCGVPYPPNSAVNGSMYMTASELTGSPSNPNPCDGVPPLVPQYVTSDFAPSDPNLDSNAIATLTNPVGVGQGCSTTQTLTGMSFTYTSGGKTFTYSGFGTGPALQNLPLLTTPVDSNLYVHFKPGCYGYIDLNKLLSSGAKVTGTSAPVLAGAVFDPGFYYFNGSGYGSSGGGLCMDGNANELLGIDVTMEFVNGSSFSVTDCGSQPASACGSSQACDYGYCSPVSGGQCTGTGTLDACSSGCPSTGYGFLSAPCSQNTNNTNINQHCLLTSTMLSSPTYSWCPSTDGSCWNTLIWTPTTITGRFFIKGPGNNSTQASYLLGSIFWQGPAGAPASDPGAGCTWYANSGGMLYGQLVCDTLAAQGGASGGLAAVGQTNSFTAGNPPEVALVE